MIGAPRGEILAGITGSGAWKVAWIEMKSRLGLKKDRTFNRKYGESGIM